MHNNLCDLAVARAADLIANKELSSVELTQAILDRINAVGDKLSAFVSVYHEEALEIAKAAESMMKVGYPLGPLHGVPIALKDNISLAGRATSAGSKILTNKTAAQDAEVVRRLKGAGANGITGIRPAIGRVSNREIIPLAWSMDTCGRIEGLRIGTIPDYFITQLQSAVLKATKEAIMRFTRIASVTGLPALSVPSGFDNDNLPIGLQLLGRSFDEGLLFKFYATLQTLLLFLALVDITLVGLHL